MKKSKKVISFTLAVLLVISLAVPAATAKAATTEQNTSNVTATTDQPYFTYNGKRLADGATIPRKGLPFKQGDYVVDLIKEATSTVEYHADGKEYTDFAYGISTKNILKELRRQNITVNGSDEDAKITGHIEGFTITLTGKSHYDGDPYSGVPVTVVIPFGTGVGFPSDKAPQVEFQQDGKDTKLPINGQFFQVARGAKFNPLDFTASDGTEYKITAPDYDLNVANNPVDTSKAGTFSTVKLNATNKNTGKKITVSYTVLVSPQNEQVLNLSPEWVPLYGFNSKTNLPDWNGSTFFYNGDKVLLGNETKIFDGVSYTKIIKGIRSSAHWFDKNSHDFNGGWIVTCYLTNIKNVPKRIVTKTLMHKAIIYNNKGKVTSKIISAFKKIKVNSAYQSIDSRVYYELANKSGYIKVGNIDGTKRVLIHNAYIYRSSNHRANSKVLKNGVTVKTYGASFKFKNGKRYYRVDGLSKQYAKVSNFNS